MQHRPPSAASGIPDPDESRRKMPLPRTGLTRYQIKQAL